MYEVPILETENLILRPLELYDFDNYYKYVTDDLIRKQFGFNHTKESCKQRLENIIKRYKEIRKPSIWAIALKDTNEMIGSISTITSFENKNFSIAYGIIKEYRNNNFAYEASLPIIDYYFNVINMHRLELAHNIDNIASQKTIEKIGAKLEGIAREAKLYDNTFVDRKIYSILKDEWEELKPSTLKLRIH